MPTKNNIPSGYLDRKEAAQLLGLSTTMFDRIAPSEFKHSRIRVGNGNAYYYSTTDLEVYRDFREKRRQSGQEELTWKQLVSRNEELAAKNTELEQSVKILVWVLWEGFPARADTKNSAAHIEMETPEKYKYAKQVLHNFGFDIEELRKRFGAWMSKNSLKQPPSI